MSESCRAYRIQGIKLWFPTTFRFYNGGLRERDILAKAYMRLIKHINSIYKVSYNLFQFVARLIFASQIRIAYEWTEDYMIKYIWSAAGYGLIAVPLLFTRTKRSLGIQTDEHSLTEDKLDNAVADRTESVSTPSFYLCRAGSFRSISAYISNRRLLLSLADAGGRLMYAYKDLLELAGLTTRLYTLLSTLHNLPPLPSAEHGDVIEFVNVDIGIPPANITGAEEVNIEGYEKVREPTQVLVKDLGLVLNEGEHLMITGSNGVGKTAVARVLAGLWAGQGSHASVSRPSQSPTNVSNGKPQHVVVIVPQRAYMVTGSLLAQIIYPHSYSDFLESGKTEEDLLNILEAVYLGYLPEREGGWETRKEWRDVLSGGEKQRVSLTVHS